MCALSRERLSEDPHVGSPGVEAKAPGPHKQDPDRGIEEGGANSQGVQPRQVLEC